MKILKFGGTSISTPIALKNVLTIVKKAVADKDSFTIVVSALQGVTDKLNILVELLKKSDQGHVSIFENIVEIHVNLACQILNREEAIAYAGSLKVYEKEIEDLIGKLFLQEKISKQDADKILSYGEIFSTSLISRYLRANLIAIDFVDSRELIVTNNNFGNASADLEVTTTRIRNYYKNNPGNKIVTGFIATNKNGEGTTLGRGGSDYTAAIFAIATRAISITKWTDVNGIMSADPKIVPDAFSLNCISYSMLLSLCEYNSKVVVHKKALIPLTKLGLPMIIKNTMDMNFLGTTVTDKSDQNTRVLSVIENCRQIKIAQSNTLSNRKLLQIKNIAKIIHSEYDGTVDYDVVIAPYSDLNNLEFLTNASLILDQLSLVVITVTGSDGAKDENVNHFNFVLKQSNIDLISVRKERDSVSFVIRQSDKTKAINILHRTLHANSSSETFNQPIQGVNLELQ